MFLIQLKKQTNPQNKKIQEFEEYWRKKVIKVLQRILAKARVQIELKKTIKNQDQQKLNVQKQSELKSIIEESYQHDKEQQNKEFDIQSFDDQNNSFDKTYNTFNENCKTFRYEKLQNLHKKRHKNNQQKKEKFQTEFQKKHQNNIFGSEEKLNNRNIVLFNIEIQQKASQNGWDGTDIDLLKEILRENSKQMNEENEMKKQSDCMKIIEEKQNFNENFKDSTQNPTNITFQEKFQTKKELLQYQQQQKISKQFLDVDLKNNDDLNEELEGQIKLANIKKKQNIEEESNINKNAKQNQDLSAQSTAQYNKQIEQIENDYENWDFDNKQVQQIPQMAKSELQQSSLTNNHNDISQKTQQVDQQQQVIKNKDQQFNQLENYDDWDVELDKIIIPAVQKLGQGKELSNSKQNNSCNPFLKIQNDLSSQNKQQIQIIDNDYDCWDEDM